MLERRQRLSVWLLAIHCRMRLVRDIGWDSLAAFSRASDVALESSLRFPECV